MTCNDYNELLSGHMDGVNSESEEQKLQQHLESCESCRELLKQMEQADAAMRDLSEEPPSDLTARVMEQVRREPKKKRPNKRKFVPMAAGGLAAAALLGFALMGGSNVPMFSDLEKAQETAAPNIGLTADAPDDAVEAFEEMFAEMEGATEADVTYTEATDAMIGALPEDETPEWTEASTEVPEQTEKTETVAAPGDSLQAPTQNIEEWPAYMWSDRGDGECSYYGSAYAADFFNEDLQTFFRYESSEKKNAPLLIIWSAEAANISELQDLQPKKSAGLTVKKERTTLYDRLLAMMPYKESAWEMTAYTADYDTVVELLRACLGSYETAVYFPAGLNDLQACTILLVSSNE